MTLGGGVAGIGFDVIGLGDAGVSLIPVQSCNEEGSGQSEDLNGEQEHRTAHTPCRRFEDRLIMSVAVVEIARCGGLHLT